ncbi:MAG: hypothetical protein GY825_15285 [Phycisphaeraceae bacterium]|nr:hypothetical protein [Phycisphaeraceae bacterium]
MRRVTELLGGCAGLLLAAGVHGQSCDTVLNTGSLDLTQGGVSCADTGITTANFFAKSYDLSVLLPGEDFELSCIEFGATNGNTTALEATITVYVDTDGGDPRAPGVDMEAIGTTTLELAGASGNVLLQASFDPPLCLGAGGTYVVEMGIPQATDGFASIAGNVGPDNQTFIRADDCGLNEYVSYASIGFDTQFWAQQLIGEAGCDGVVCDCYTGSDCFVPHEEPGCDDPICSATVCSFDQFCCDVTWDDSCSALAEAYCGVSGFPCDFPTATSTETEPCGQDTNGGCNMDVPAFEAISVGDVVAGTYFADETAEVRDTDWYEFTIEERSIVTWTVWSRVAVDNFIINDQCGDLLAIVAVGSGECPNVNTACLEAGTYRAFVAPVVDGNLPCDLPEFPEYVASLEAEPVDGCPGFDECVGGTESITPNSGLELTAGGISCAAGGITTENTWAVTLDLATGTTGGSDVSVSCVEFGVNNGGSAVPASVQLWIDTDGGDPVQPGVDLELIGTRETVAVTGANLQRASFDPPICVPADSQLVVSLSMEPSTDGFATFGGNNLPSSSGTFILSDSCGLATFTNLIDIGFPDINWVVDVEADLECGGGSDCTGDFNGDGVVDGADFGFILAAWGPCPGCPEDLDGNGTVNGADVGLLLAVWGPCP